MPNRNGVIDISSSITALTQGILGQSLSRKGNTPSDAVWTNSLLNIESFGGIGDGSTDNSIPLNLALASLPAGGGGVYFPRGKYVFTSKISFTYTSANQSIMFVGDGQNNTELCWPLTDGVLFTLKDTTTTFHARNIAFTTGTTELREGIRLSIPGTNANGALGEYSDFNCVVFRGSDGYAKNFGWKTGLVIDNVSNVNVDGSSFIGTGASRGYGIRVSGNSNDSFAVVYNFSKSSWVHLEVGVEYGSYVQGMTISQCNFTATTNGVIVPSTAVGILSQLTIVASQFAPNPDANGASINIMTGVNPLTIADNLFLSNGGGTQINLAAHSFTSISGNVLYSPNPNNNTAFNMGTGASPTKVADNVIFGFALGLALPNTTSNASITNNAMIGNTQAISFNSTNTNANRMTGNSGFQPQAPVAQGVSSSPWTYASPGLPANVYITGGTVSSVKVDGVTIATSAPGCVPLEPNQVISVTYSSVPSIVIGIR